MSKPVDIDEQLDATAAATPATLEAGAGEAVAPAPPFAAVFDARTAQVASIYDLAIAVLTWGFRTGAAILALGLGWALIRREPLGREAEPFAEILPTILDGHASGVVDVAILWIVATPVATTLAVAIGFLRTGDRLYAALSLIVLAILGVSISLAIAR